MASCLIKWAVILIFSAITFLKFLYEASVAHRSDTFFLYLFLFFNLMGGLTFKRAITSTHDSFGSRLLTPGRRVKVLPFHKYEFIFHAHVFEI